MAKLAHPIILNNMGRVIWEECSVIPQIVCHGPARIFYRYTAVFVSVVLCIIAVFAFG